MFPEDYERHKKVKSFLGLDFTMPYEHLAFESLKKVWRKVTMLFLLSVSWAEKFDVDKDYREVDEVITRMHVPIYP